MPFSDDEKRSRSTVIIIVVDETGVNVQECRGAEEMRKKQHKEKKSTSINDNVIMSDEIVCR